MDKPQISIVNEKTMKSDKNGINFGDYKMSLSAIPDLNKLTRDVLDIVIFLEDGEIDKLVVHNESDVKMIINNKYADTVPFGIISLLVDRQNRAENVERLLRMFESMDRAKKGEKPLADVEKELYDDINTRYVYSKYGSKGAFEKELMKGIGKKK